MSESNLRVVVVDKTEKRKTGPCKITRNPAAIRSPITRTVRKYQTRLWFSANEDELTPSQANNVLTFGRGQPSYGKIFIVIISLVKGEHERFAGDDDALCQVMRAATIEAMNRLATEVGADRLIWIARAHPDYPQPCVKVLINRTIAIDDGCSLQELKRFPRHMRTHWLKQEKPGDPRVAVSGGCGDTFLRAFDVAASESIKARKETPAMRNIMSDEEAYNQIPMLSAGNYRVTVESAMLKRAPTREPMIEYLFRVMDGEQQGQHRRSQQIITSVTYERMMQNLNVCGISCQARDIAGHLPRTRGVELDILIGDDAAAVVFTCRLDSRSLSERGISEDTEPLPDVAALFGLACGDMPRLEACSVEDWEYGDSLLLELDPTFQTIEREQ